MKFTTAVALLAVCALAAVAAAEAATPKKWVVIVAGSNGYWNYRHQADVAHAYQIAKKGGIPESQIITFAYNDIANDTENPFPGQVFNKPTPAGVPGVDVWKDFKIDYEGDSVSVPMFIAALTGDSTTTGGKKVLKSGKDDHVFIYFADHGGTGIICFPNDDLSVQQLQTTVKTMETKGMFGKLVFYIEACESGSMFDGWLPTNTKVYATTAANPDESSYGFYCSPDDMVNGKEIGSCLGDEYSITWLESVDANGTKQSLEANFEFVRDKVKLSHVQQYGDVSFKNDSMSEFLAAKKSSILYPKPSTGSNSGINSRDIKLHYMFNKYFKSKAETPEKNFENGLNLMREIQHRLTEDFKFNTLATTLAGAKGALMHTNEVPRPAISCGKCCEDAFKVLRTQCGGFSDYNLKYARTIHNLCAHSEEVASKVASTLSSICAKPIPLAL